MRYPLLWLAALALAGCTGGASRLALEKPAALEAFTPELKIETRWAREIGRGTDRYHLQLAPLIDGVRLYVVNHKGRVEAYEHQGGEKLWRRELDVRFSTGAGDGGDVLLLGGDAEVIALDKADGALRWRAPVSSEVLATPVSSGEVVVVHTIDGAVFGLARDDGRRLWRYAQPVPLLSLHGASAPQVAGGSAIVGFANGRLAALALQDGRLQWEAAVAVSRGRTELERVVDVDGQLMVRDGVVYAVSYQGRLAALALESGRMLWTREFSSFTGVAVAGRDLYVTDAAGDLWALARHNGGTLWKQTALHGRWLTAPAVQGDALVVADFDGYVHWLAREDGRLLARARVEDRETLFPVPPEVPHPPYDEDRAILAPPQVMGELVYLMDKRGVLNTYSVTR